MGTDWAGISTLPSEPTVMLAEAVGRSWPKTEFDRSSKANNISDRAAPMAAPFRLINASSQIVNRRNFPQSRTMNVTPDSGQCQPRFPCGASGFADAFNPYPLQACQQTRAKRILTRLPLRNVFVAGSFSRDRSLREYPAY